MTNTTSDDKEHSVHSNANVEQVQRRLDNSNNEKTNLELDGRERKNIEKKPFSVFTNGEKWFIVVMAGIAALFSPLTANIYFPAIPTIANAFGKSIELINLTVTVYMIVQGISPMFWGTMADRWGRRPVYLACLFVLIVTDIGLALVPTSAYWLLMVLRCLQAAGSASTVALGAGTIVDIATPEERGGFLGLFTLGPMVGPCIGPVLGGVLADKLGWRAIFWFLAIASGCCLMFIFSLMPETLRIIVGDGSIPPPKLYTPLIPVIGRSQCLARVERPKGPKKPIPNPLRLFTCPDVVILLVFNAVVYSVFYGVTTTISTLFADVYPFLNETSIGLCFLAIGGGMAFGSYGLGRWLDWEYSSIKKRIERELNKDREKAEGAWIRVKDEDYPIEYARLRTMPIHLGIFVACCFGYGWSLEKKANLAVPLILQFIMGIAVIGVMNTTQTLIMDLFPKQGSSVTAANNLVRCSFGAGLVSVIDLIINALHPGWTYILLGGACLILSPLILVEIRMGPKWRAKRRERAKATA